MPELPEVTTMVADLNRLVKGKRIADVWTDTPRIVRPLTASAFRFAVRGKRFTRFRRAGKYIIADLRGSARAARTRDWSLVWHMRMTGHPLFRDERRETSAARRAFSDPRNQHIRLVFSFTDGTRLLYSDARKFGTLHALPTAYLARHLGLSALGPDALRHRWTPAALSAALRAHDTTVKQALLDQTRLAGIGNIYADEILWTARLHPRTRTTDVTRADAGRLVSALRQVLTKAVRRRGSSINDFRDVRGRKGTYGSVRKAYQRHGQPCFRCGATLARMIVGGRGTHVCPSCQRAPGPAPRRRQRSVRARR